KYGCFAIVLEKIPAELGKKVSQSLQIPTIGIGAGPDADGQVLVMQDMLGITKEFKPRFLRRYADLSTIVNDAVTQYVNDVKAGDFPNETEQYCCFGSAQRILATISRLLIVRRLAEPHDPILAINSDTNRFPFNFLPHAGVDNQRIV